MQIKQFFFSLLFYPVFIGSYLAYSLIYKISVLIQWLFKVIYIEHICGFKRKQKITEAINSLNKIPQSATLVLNFQNISPFKSEIKQRETIKYAQQFQKNIAQNYMEILNDIEELKQINIICDSQTIFIDQFCNQIQKKAVLNLKKIKLVNRKIKLTEEVEILTNLNKNNVPLVIVFGNYQNICQIPAKYLVNSEISFNSNIFQSNMFDLYKSFCQYANSKQRNGK